MKQTAKNLMALPCIFGLLLLNTCLTTNTAANSPSQSHNTEAQTRHETSPQQGTVQNTAQSPAQTQAASFFSGNGGRGITIAVPAPVLLNTAAADNWMSQFFQDRMTGDIARFSAMTVLDRSNEQMALAEQSLSVSGNYSDNDFIRIGNLTNAQFIVAGNIHNISGRYNVSLRINNTETNEIQASFDRPYSISDIESGLAPKEAVRELLAGMGIELTEAGERTLLTIHQVEVRATAQLARGMASARSGNVIESMDFLADALNASSTRVEAERHIQDLFSVIPPNNIRERADFYLEQTARWNKIFADLADYIHRNLPVFVYDLSSCDDDISIRNNWVNLTYRPGIKVVPNRNVLLTYKRVYDEWAHIRQDEDNRIWTNNVRSRIPGGPASISSSSIDFRAFYFTIFLYDEHGERIHNDGGIGGYGFRLGLSIERDRNFQVLAQHRYYENSQFHTIRFGAVSLDRVTDYMTPKIERAYYSNFTSGSRRMEIDYPIMTIAEYQDWLTLQGTAR